MSGSFRKTCRKSSFFPSFSSDEPGSVIATKLRPWSIRERK
jgi:hypothetical protein